MRMLGNENVGTGRSLQVAGDPIRAHTCDMFCRGASDTFLSVGRVCRRLLLSMSALDERARDWASSGAPPSKALPTTMAGHAAPGADTMPRDADCLAAQRTSKYMRQHMGFYPTSGKHVAGSDVEWSLFVDVNTHVTRWLRAQGVTGANARHKLSEINKFALHEAHELWLHVKFDKALASLLPDQGACDAYVFAVIYAVMGSYNAFVSRTRYTRSAPASAATGGGGAAAEYDAGEEKLEPSDDEA